MKPSVFRYTASPLECEDLRILGVGLHEAMPPGLVHRPHGLGSYLLTIFHRETMVRHQRKDQPCPPHSLIIWEPDVCQTYGNPSMPWEYSWMTCDGPFVRKTLETLAIPLDTVIMLTDPSPFAQFEQGVFREFAQYACPDPALMRNYVFNLLLDIKRHLTAPDTSAQLPGWAMTIKQYFAHHFADAITIDQVAERAHLSVTHFYRKFKQLFGIAPMEYLTHIRMHAAKELLLDDNLSIADIAMRTGYDNPNYFAAAFRHYYALSPREMRKGLSGETGRQQRAQERRSRELAYWLRAGWQLVLDDDFAHVASLDPRLYGFWSENFGLLLPTQQPPCFIDGCLRLPLDALWTGICWETPLGEEIKLEVVAANSSADGLNLTLAISGDIHQGYRLRLSRYDFIALETTINGHWEILHRCPATLDPHARDYHISYWRSDNVFYAEIDGQRILEYHEPFSPQGAAHRCFAIARFHSYGSADLRVLRVFTRITPRYVDMLEPGRVLLREGFQRNAQAWFLRMAVEHRNIPLYHEALYLAALAAPETERLEKEQAFHRVMADTANPFRRRLLRQWALTRLAWEDITGAVDLALELARLYPDDDTPRLLGEKLMTLIHQMAPADLEHALAAVVRLPLTSLRFQHLPLTSLAQLAGMRLRELYCDGMQLTDLSPLQGMPLEHLQLDVSARMDLTPLANMPLTWFSCTGGQLQELSPLRGMSLRFLCCSANMIRDLSPLTGMPLEHLYCERNEIQDLSPLHGMPLDLLHCSVNSIRDLSPLAGAPLGQLYCDQNAIRDLSPLRALPLHVLNCSANPIEQFAAIAGLPLQQLICAHTRITDLAPLRDMPLVRVTCPGNHVTDLSPLAGKPLQQLSCGDNPITSLQPLSGMPLADLAIEGIPLNQENTQVLQGLPLQHLCCDFTASALTLLQTHPTLLGLNHHTRTYLRAMADALLQAIDAWRHGAAGNDGQHALHHFATACGDVRYLVLPFHLTRHDAEDFCRYCGGTLACPSTAEQYQALLAYLAGTRYPDSLPLCYHLGLTADPATGNYRWLSGASYQWHHWLAKDGLPPPPTAIPGFVGRLRYEYVSWEWTSNADARYYVAMEWPEEA